jgi:(1->4)-alpha-D-glucan 1-alpha-D-glucosylmutase
LNSLAQVLLKIASPGVPDIYQGNEVWDFSLVDPDNRRPVDYERRRKALGNLQARLTRARTDRLELARELLQRKEDGRVKLYVTMQALRCRRDQAGLFATGEYLPADAGGVRAAHVFAFARRLGRRWAVVAVPRLLTRLTPRPEILPLGKEVWQDTQIALPGLGAGGRCRNVFTGEVLTLTAQGDQGSLSLAEVFANFPVALLVGED